ncbi:MAG TPA: hypothetical protein VJ836_06840 [Candidatus Saccharimonadales bacterium]|nr:hypothetical protein [Candidatus Saccharimonadales bacterium]
MIKAGIRQWGAQYPETLQFFDRLNMAQARWGLFSGTLLQLLGIRETDDHDVLVDGQGFDQAARILQDARGIRPVRKEVYIACGDGEKLHFRTQELSAQFEGKTVQIMRPAPVECSTGSEYYLAMTWLAAEKRAVETVRGVEVYAADPVDSLLSKAVMQRGQDSGKQDVWDTAMLGRHGDLDMAYLEMRAAEIRADARVTAFLAMHAGLFALECAALDRDMMPV